MKEYLDKDFKESLEEIFRYETPRRVLLVTGKESYENSPAKAFFDGYDSGTEFVTYNDFSPNPKHEELRRAIEFLASEMPDLIIGIGGGSVMDFAKLLNVYMSNPAQIDSSPNELKQLTPVAPMVLIPTTSGSGSEATFFAVLYKEGKKYSVAIKEALAEYVVVDPALTHSMSPYLTACTGIDALCQAIESFWAKGATTKSLQYSKKAMSLIVPTLAEAVNNPSPQSRKDMALGAFYAGKAINISKTTGPHAFSYYITSKYVIPHGEAVSMTFAFFILNNFDALDEKRKDTYRALFNFETKEEFASQFIKLKEAINLNNTFCSLGINNEPHLSSFLQGVNHQRLTNNPVKIDMEAMKKWIEEC